MFMVYRDTNEPTIWNENIWKKENRILPKENENLQKNYVKEKIA